MKNKENLILLLLLLAIVGMGLSGCFANSAKPFDNISNIKSYRDVPGITSGEIAAIQAFQASGRSFSYGSMRTTEAFKLPDGSNAGFSTLFTEFLSNFFNIPFLQQTHGWDTIINGLENMTLDFTGDAILTPERRQIYFMTNPIAARSLGIFYLDKDGDNFKKEEDINGLTIGFYEGGVIAQSIMEAYPDLNFKIVHLLNSQDLVENLASGKIDAFVTDAVISVEFEDYPWIKSKEYFPLVYAPVSMTTKNPELKPVISIVDKYIEAGGIDNLFYLYDRGRREYAKHELRRTFSGEEAAYVENLEKKGIKIPVALEHDYYPVCFFNKKENEFQGSMPDMLREISLLTGMEFQIVTDKDTPFYKALEMVDKGEAAFVSALGYTPERKEKYLWSERYYTCYYALLSKIDYPHLDMYQVARAKVGVSRGTNYEELYKSWFKHDSNLVYYDSIIEAMNALENGEVDLVMASENALFTMNNYFEKPGYKANILFNAQEEVYLGFNKNEEILASIISKAQKQINIERINNQWKSRVFNYARKLAEAQRPWLIGAIFLSSIVLTLLIFLFYRKRNEGKRLERLVAERTAVLNAMFDSIPDIVICKDLNLNYTRCNKFAEEVNGIREKDIIGKGDIDGFGFPADVAEMIMEADRTTLREGRKVSTEEKITYSDGITRTLETVRMPVRQDGVITGLIAIARDITQHKAAEEAAQIASRSKSVFLANMSHEIRTPMNSIIGFSELALDGEINPKTKEYLNRILDNSGWLLQIINDILDISKIESGKMEIENIPFDLHELFAACRALITPKAEEKGIALHFYAEPSIGKKLLGDSTRLRQVLINILSNAVKFTNTGSVKMAAAIKEALSNSKESDGGTTICFEVKDSGIGMTGEQITKIFEPFMQAESGTTRKYGGTGLGLAITKSIIELMGGTLSVESTPGLGSKFSFELAFKTIDAPEYERPVKVKQIEKPVFDGEVLLCEDNKMNQHVICEHLMRVGLKIIVAENGREGVEIVNERKQSGKKRFDLIFMDIHMPVMDGLEATAEIIKLGTGTPIIAMTANIMADDREQYIANGMSDCVGKPFTSQDLWRCLLRHLVPVNRLSVNDTQDRDADELLRQMLIRNFVKEKQTLYNEIVKAIEGGGIKLAHRLAHSLKGNAGQLGKTSLQKAAAAVENHLKDEKNLVTPEEMSTLETELNAVLKEWAPQVMPLAAQLKVPGTITGPVDAEKAKALIKKLEPLLESGSPECLNCIDSLRSLPGCGELIEQIENFDFDSAKNTLTGLKIKWMETEKHA